MTEVVTALEGALVADAGAPSVVKKRTEESRFGEYIEAGTKADSGLDFLAEAAGAAASPARTKSAKTATSERTLSGGESFQSTDPLMLRGARGGKRGRRRAGSVAAWWAKNQLWAIGGGAAAAVVVLAVWLSPSSKRIPEGTVITPPPPEMITVTRGSDAQAVQNATSPQPSTGSSGNQPAPAATATTPTFTAADGPSIGGSKSYRRLNMVEGQVIDLLATTDLSDWEQFGGSPDSWKMEGWVLTGRGPLNRLVYRPATFADFDLRAEVRLGEGANSGIYLRCDLSAETFNGYEIQLGQVGIPSTRDTATGGLYGRAPYQQRIVGDNEWMVVGASVRGSRVSVSINGRQTVDYTDPNNSFPAGYIGVQGHHPGMKVEFRQLHVVPLRPGTPVTPPSDIAIGLKGIAPLAKANVSTSTPVPTTTAPGDAGWTNLFNGKDLTGWTVSGAPSWGVQGGVLKVTGTERGYLFTDRQYSDFELELEFRTPPRGNSGVLFWVPSLAQFDIRTKLEVQICDDLGAPQGEQRPDRLTGGIYNGVGRVPQAAPVRPDFWHTMRIRLVEKRIEVLVDGTRYLYSYLPQSSLPPGLMPDVAGGMGHIGLMAWGSAVEFRSVRVRDMKPVQVVPGRTRGAGL
jgi:hypothetical protein